MLFTTLFTRGMSVDARWYINNPLQYSSNTITFTKFKKKAWCDTDEQNLWLWFAEFVRKIEADVYE